jgi:Histidine kinase-, DNA gyrase B-, and HSP90-like ATPase
MWRLRCGRAQIWTPATGRGRTFDLGIVNLAEQLGVTDMAMTRSARAVPKYSMKISRLTVDKLGVKLYDRVSAVIAELVSNSYDADATKVSIEAPMGEYLATRPQDQIIDRGYEIVVEDNGIGMTDIEVNKYFLRIGAERRKDERGDTSKKFGRKVMGNKGVGKLAPFGICQRIELRSAGGKPVAGHDAAGKKTKGYLTAHLILDRDEILQDEEFDYSPAVGSLDGTVSKTCGTRITLRSFAFRKVPTLEEFSRQLAQRFGVKSADWKIELLDTVKTPSDPSYRAIVGQFDIKTMPNTKITFKPTSRGEIEDRVFDSNDEPIDGLNAGFDQNNEKYPIRGWVAYAKEPYKDDLMAGVRIYCRGKIAAQTSIFNRRAGFTGEHDVRSYLVGELHADWLDEDEDLIQTDRRDILWSHELGQEFENWGQSVIKKIGTRSRDPMKKKTWDRFKEITKLEKRIKTAFPRDDQSLLRTSALDVAKMIGQTMRADEVEDLERANSLVQLSIMLAPVITLDDRLRAAAEASESPLDVVTGILRTARIAELASFGRIAEDRIRVIERVEALKDHPETLESALQTLIETSPWLIDPQWSPIAANQSFSTLRKEFAKYYAKHEGKSGKGGKSGDLAKRPDFVMSNQDGAIQLIEIKRPQHKLTDPEVDRIVKYRDLMRAFLNEEGNEEFLRLFRTYQIILVCDHVSLDGTHGAALAGMKTSRELVHITWKAFLLKTRQMHKSFLDEADRLKKDANAH